MAELYDIKLKDNQTVIMRDPLPEGRQVIFLGPMSSFLLRQVKLISVLSLVSLLDFCKYLQHSELKGLFINSYKKR